MHACMRVSVCTRVSMGMGMCKCKCAALPPPLSSHEAPLPFLFGRDVAAEAVGREVAAAALAAAALGCFAASGCGVGAGARFFELAAAAGRGSRALSSTRLSSPGLEILANSSIFRRHSLLMRNPLTMEA